MRAEVCARAGRCQILHIYIESAESSPTPPARSPQPTLSFRACVRSLLAPVLFSRCGDEPNAAGRRRRIPVETFGRGGSRSGVSVVALPTGALQTAQRLTVRAGAARPSRVEVESRRGSCASGVTARHLLRLSRCCSALWRLFPH